MQSFKGIGLSSKGFYNTLSSEEIQSIKQALDSDHFVYLNNFIDKNVLLGLDNYLKKLVKKTISHDYLRKGVFEQSLVQSDGELPKKINFLFASKDYQSFITALLSTDKTPSFYNRIFLLDSTSKEGIPWHDDSNYPGRVMGLSILLGEPSFDGGEFEIRAIGEEKAHSVKCRNAGDAILFRIHPGYLEHRVRPVLSGERTVFLQWVFSREVKAADD